MKKTKDLIFGGALTLQSVDLLNDRSTAGLTKTMTGFVNVGVAGSMANVAFDMVTPKKRRKRRSKK